MTKIGLFGGTFDPLHNGHYELVHAAVRHGLERVIVMPSGRPPHKTGEAVSMAGYRFEMASRAFAGQPHITVSDLEIRRPGPSYTLDTIRLIREKLSEGEELVLVCGSDVLDNIEKWHDPAGIMAACPLLVAQRGGSKAEENQLGADKLRQRYHARIHFFDAPEIEISSSQIRQTLQSGGDFGSLLPDAVVKIINKNGLYRYQDELNSLDMTVWQCFYEIERLLWPVLSRKRLLHSLNVLVYALHLARVHGVPPEQTGITALLHDCAKCLTEEKTARYARKSGIDSLMDPALAHGPAGCHLAGERFKISDPAILRAILYHTTGCGGMSKMERIIFIADKVEPARPYPNLEEIRRLAETDLDNAMLVCLREIDLFLERENLKSHPLAQEARDDCIRRLAEKKKHEADHDTII
jgi:nicotinate-nucleotide adenylyltransferase